MGTPCSGRDISKLAEMQRNRTPITLLRSIPIVMTKTQESRLIVQYRRERCNQLRTALVSISDEESQRGELTP